MIGLVTTALLYSLPAHTQFPRRLTVFLPKESITDVSKGGWSGAVLGADLEFFPSQNFPPVSCPSDDSLGN